MRLRNVKNAREKLLSSPYFIENPMEYKGTWKHYFQGKVDELPSKICVEIGCGKGQFLVSMAQKYPDVCFIGIEKYESVLVRAVELASNFSLSNLCFLALDAKEITNVFASEIDTLYLNFSDPWPKARHAKRRLTSFSFLKLYDEIFAGDAKIIQKTDNLILFASSLENYSQYGYVLQTVCMDLHHSSIPNVMSEYEMRFSKLGEKINYVEAIKKKSEK